MSQDLDVIVERCARLEFAPVPMGLLMDTEIPAGAVRVWGLLYGLSFDRGRGTDRSTRRSKRAMAKAWGMSDRTLRRHVSKLASKRWLYERQVDTGGLFPATLLTVFRDPGDHPKARGTRAAPAAHTPHPRRFCPDPAANQHPKERANEREHPSGMEPELHGATKEFHRLVSAWRGPADLQADARCFYARRNATETPASEITSRALRLQAAYEALDYPVPTLAKVLSSYRHAEGDALAPGRIEGHERNARKRSGHVTADERQEDEARRHAAKRKQAVKDCERLRRAVEDPRESSSAKTAALREHNEIAGRYRLPLLSQSLLRQPANDPGGFPVPPPGEAADQRGGGLSPFPSAPPEALRSLSERFAPPNEPECTTRRLRALPGGKRP